MATVNSFNSLVAVRGAGSQRSKVRSPRTVRSSRLTAAPALFPAALLSDDFAAACATTGIKCRWWLAYTRPQQEQALTRELLARNVAYYLPLIHRKTMAKGRTHSVRVPLFPGYVFIWGSEEDRFAALKTNRLVSIYDVAQGERLKQQLAQFATAIAAGAPLVRESRLIAGECVRIKTGLFRDLEGVVLRRNGKTELLIAIDFLHQGATMEIEDGMIEAV